LLRPRPALDLPGSNLVRSPSALDLPGSSLLRSPSALDLPAVPLLRPPPTLDRPPRPLLRPPPALATLRMPLRRSRRTLPAPGRQPHVAKARRQTTRGRGLRERQVRASLGLPPTYRGATG
jgi:hypothetical protein